MQLTVVTPLANAVIPVFAICTFDTDYILVQESDLSNAIDALEHVGYQVSRAVSSVLNGQVRDEVD